MLINERTNNNRRRNYFSKNFYSKAHKLILKSNSRHTNLARGSVHASKIGWAHGKNYSTQISNQGAQADLKMYKTSKIKYSQTRNFHDYTVQNVLENSSKTSLLGGVSKQAKRSFGHDENSVHFIFLEGQFYKEKPSFVNLKKTKHSFEVSSPICLF